MALAKPAGCLLQVVGACLFLGGIGACALKMAETDSVSWGWLAVVFIGLLVLYIGGKPARGQ